MAEVSANGTSLYYERHGEGPSVVLVHGSWGDADNWSRVVPGLAEECTVVAYDRRGHSRSQDGVLAGGSVHEDAADLAGVIEGLGLAPVFVCANSYGSLITLRLAATRPELLRGIAAHEPPGVALLRDDPDLKAITSGVADRMGSVRVLLEAGDSLAAAELFVESIAFGPGTWPQLPESVRRTFVRNAPTFLGELRDPDGLDLDLTALGRYRAPTLLTRSDNSPPMFKLILDRIALALPHAESHIYSGAGHTPHVTNPDEYVRVTLPRALAAT